MPEAQTFSWGQMMDQAEQAAPPSFDPTPIGGPYDFLVTSGAVTTAQSGKKGIRINAVVESGPHKGTRASVTQYISPDNAVAMSIFFRIMNNLGINKAWFANFMDRPVDDPYTLEQMAEAIKGARFSGTVKEHNTNGDRVYANVLVNGPAKAPAPAQASAPASPGPAAPAAPAAPAVPVAQPAAQPAAPAPQPAAQPAASDLPSPWEASPPPPPPLGGGAPF